VVNSERRELRAAKGKSETDAHQKEIELTHLREQNAKFWKRQRRALRPAPCATVQQEGQSLRARLADVEIPMEEANGLRQQLAQRKE
jgi:hypothetical protein